ncbi:MFS transporter [Actinomadura namibiensis]|uniref:Putative MFS family arabinose efflux permease n=1 Tax=Actinomadura namibiensis TaxID=182080 RepID=A0A7W3QLJ8_ACTNM|nr:MFS transporter [Actinomadura namibiensis]MBA8951491.1 putative MFS family arabinose efflux permease [Actinomadura namibiensis]
MSVASPVPAVGVPRSSADPRRIDLALFAAGLTTFMSLYCTQALLPELSGAFAVSPARASLLVSLATGAVALAVIPVSSLSERYGRTRVMLWSSAASVLVGLLIPLCSTFGALAAARAAQGVALAGVPAVAMAYLADEVPRERLGGAMGRYVAGTGIGGVLGRLVPGVTTDFAGWRWALAVTALVALAFTVAFWVLLPPSRGFRPSRVDYRPLLAHLRDPGLRRLYVVALMAMAGFVTVYNFLSYRLLEAPFHLPQAVVGLIAVTNLAGSVASARAGVLADRAGRRPVLLGAVGLAAAGLLLTLPPWLPAVALGLLLFTCGFFATHAVASGWVGLRARTARAQASALYLFAYYLGSSVGGSAGGVAFEGGAWTGTGLYVLATLAVAAVAAAGVRPRVRRSPGPGEPG